MLFRGKRLQDFTIHDVQSFIDNKVPETAILDYKRECKLGAEQDKTEFIYDVTAFYNTEGGCIVFGLEEEKDEAGKNTGIPKLPTTPINVLNYDQLKLQIEDCIKQTTSPSIVNLAFSPLFEIEGSNMFILGIPKSTNLPAMVTYKWSGRFYKRKSTGKYQVDTYELSDLFTRNLIAQNEVMAFVRQRREEVLNDIFWPQISSENGLLMHIVPVSHFHEIIKEFSETAFRNNAISLLKPPGSEGYDYRYCFEGLHTYISLQRPDITVTRYALLFRNGAIESYTNMVFSKQEGKYPTGLYTAEFLKILKQQVENAFKFFNHYSIEPQYYLTIYLNNVYKFELITHESSVRRTNWKKNYLEFPGIFFTREVTSIKRQVKQVADILWQTAGLNECPTAFFNSVFDRLELE